MPRKTIADAAEQLLAERRAATSEELGESIAAAGLTRAASPTRAVSRALGADQRFRRLRDRRWVYPATLLQGAVLTHRPTSQELDNAVLTLMPDLAPLSALTTRGLQTADGSRLALAWDEEARDLTGVDTDIAVQGPPGWLGHLHEGRPRLALLHVRLADRRLEPTWGPPPESTARMTGRRIVEGARQALDREPLTESLVLPRCVTLSEVLLSMLVDDPELLRTPLAPLGELFDGSDLEVHRGWVGDRGADWTMLDELMSLESDWDALDDDVIPWPAGDGAVDEHGFDPDLEDEDDAALSARMAETFGLAEAQVEGLRIVLGAYELSCRGRDLKDPLLLAGLAPFMADAAVAHVLGFFARSDDAFEPFVAGIEAAADGADASGPRYLWAICAEAREDVVEAERRLRGALAADPGFEPAAMELVRYETDRGRFGEALRLLRDSGIEPDDLERAWLEDISRSAFPKVGRNEPCPCGSGRKYKACHLGREVDVVAVDPARALLHKLWLWLEQPQGQRLLDELLMEVVPDSARPERDDDERESLDGPMLDDVILYDRGELERYLRLRGPLLPGPELELGRRWLRTRRSIYEVVSVRPDKGLTVRDLSAGAGEIVLHDRSVSRQVERLDLLCMRLVPDGSGGLTPASALLVPRTQRAHLVDIIGSGDPMALLSWIARPDTMPRLANMEGEPVRSIEATYRVPDPVAAAAALGRRLNDEGEGRFVEMVTRKGEDWIRGSITIEGDVARVQTNSTKRADRLERTLLRAAPGSRLIRREEQGVEEAIEDHRAKRAGAGGDDDSIDPGSHPELAAALEQMMRRYEERWVDESIPALGGLTPREALTDPTMRQELEALLDDMTWQHRHAGPGSTMDPARIRRRLGL